MRRPHRSASQDGDSSKGFIALGDLTSKPGAFPAGQSSYASHNFRRQGVVCVLLTLAALALLIIARTGISSTTIRAGETEVHLEAAGQFALVFGGEQRLQGWLQAAATANSPFRPSLSSSGCIELTATTGSGVHLSMASGGWWYGGPEVGVPPRHT